MKKYLPLLLICVSCGVPSRNLRYSYNIIQPKTIIPHELNYMLKNLDTNSFILVDLRSTDAYEKGHIQRALSLPFKNISSITNIPDYQDKRLIMYDSSELQYFRLAAPMRKLSITNYYILQNGWEGWEEYKNENK